MKDLNTYQIQSEPLAHSKISGPSNPLQVTAVSDSEGLRTSERQPSLEAASKNAVIIICSAK